MKSLYKFDYQVLNLSKCTIKSDLLDFSFRYIDQGYVMYRVNECNLSGRLRTASACDLVPHPSYLWLCSLPILRLHLWHQLSSSKTDMLTQILYREYGPGLIC
jgi:hypothetical protein